MLEPFVEVIPEAGESVETETGVSSNGLFDVPEPERESKTSYAVSPSLETPEFEGLGESSGGVLELSGAGRSAIAVVEAEGWGSVGVVDLGVTD